MTHTESLSVVYTFNKGQKYIALFSGEDRDTVGRRVETKIPIASVEDIYQHADTIKATCQHYDGHAPDRQGE